MTGHIVPKVTLDGVSLSPSPESQPMPGTTGAATTTASFEATTRTASARYAELMIEADKLATAGHLVPAAKAAHQAAQAIAITRLSAKARIALAKAHDASASAWLIFARSSLDEMNALGKVARLYASARLSGQPTKYASEDGEGTAVGALRASITVATTYISVEKAAVWKPTSVVGLTETIVRKGQRDAAWAKLL